MSSPAEDKSISMPWMSPFPETLIPVPILETLPPIRVSNSIKSLPTWVVLSGQFSIVTVPPATSAAAINGPAFDKSGSISTVLPEISPGSICQEVSLSFDTFSPRLARVSIVMSMCGIEGRVFAV